MEKDSKWPLIKDGYIDLADWDFQKSGGVDLNGRWQFYPYRLPQNIPERPGKNGPIYLQAPMPWNGQKLSDGNKMHRKGFGTYRIRIRLAEHPGNLALRIIDIGTAYELYWNGKKILATGKIADDSEGSHPRIFPTILRLKNIQKENELLIGVSNYHHARGGIRQAIRLDQMEALSSGRILSERFLIFLVGALAIMALYHLALYILRPEDSAGILFAVFCLSAIVWLAGMEYKTAFVYFPWLPWEILSKLEYLSAYIAVPVLFEFLGNFYREQFRGRIFQAIRLFMFVQILPVLLTPSIYFTAGLFLWKISAIITSIYCMYGLLRALKQSRLEALPAILGFVILFAAILNDSLHEKNWIHSAHLLTGGGFVFIFAQSFMLSLKYSRAFSKIEKLSEDLVHTNDVYSRFVPNQFLSLLRKHSIIEIDRGDSKEGRMTLMLADIRSFTAMSEKMSPAENFDFLNAYLGHMTPHIEKNFGFIDKYIGDAVMALFPRNAKDALRSAALMQEELRNYNQQRVAAGFDAIRVGIGIHTGDIMIGIIGGPDRLEPTVISAAVQFTVRIERITERSGAGVLFSKETLDALDPSDKPQYRLLDKIQMKGSSEIMPIYELLDAYAPGLQERLLSSRSEFESAVELTLEKKYGDALLALENVLKICAEDLPAVSLQARCRSLQSESRSDFQNSPETNHMDLI